MVGGELTFNYNPTSQTWEPQFHFRIPAPVAGDKQLDAFLRVAYRMVKAGWHAWKQPWALTGDGKEVAAAREDAPLTDEEADELTSWLGDLRNVGNLTVALIADGAGLGDAAAEVAGNYGAPVLVVDDSFSDGIRVMSQGQLLQEIQRLWEMFPDPAPPQQTAAEAILQDPPLP